jgi:antitoxin (DNA-binding transcriptional repressor) of toxin-antitoxin stability system
MAKPKRNTKPQTISITKARNRFFELVNKSYKKNKIFKIEKGGIPVAQITPVDEEE